MILETKLSLPQPKAGALLRTGLIELIKNNLDKKLILITAGAGYGKTTLLAQLVKNTKLPVVFYDIDKGDSDLMGFYTYLVNGIKQIGTDLVKYSEELLRQGGEIGKNAELLFGTLINELYEKRKEELFIILDNYHNIAEDSAVHSALNFFIDRLPEKIHVIISARSVPPLPAMARWRAKQDLFDLSQDELSFSPDETALLLKTIYKSSLSDKDIRQVAAHAEGWITGIRLIMQTTGQGGASVSENLRKQIEACQPLYEYFSNEILSAEPEKLRVFLIKCSILETMTPEACDALLNSSDSRQVLKRLEKRHLFITAISEKEYKYHHLFREFLQNRLNDEGPALHRKAAHYFARQWNVEPAIEHYLEAKAHEKAGRLIYEVAEKMILNTRFTVLENWLQRIPEESILQQPGLLIIWCEINREQGRLQEAEAKISKALPLLNKSDNNEALAMALLERAVLFWINNDFDQTLKALRQALAFARHRLLNSCSVRRLKGKIITLTALVWIKLGAYNKAKACLLQVRQLRKITDNPYDYFTAESNLALLCSAQGEARLAYNAYRALIPRMEGRYYCDAGDIHFKAVLAAVHTGDIEWAEWALAQGWALCRPYNDPQTTAHLELGSGILCLQQAQWETALRHLAQAASLFNDLGMASMHCFALRDISLVHRYQGNYLKAQEFLGQAFAATGEKASQLLASLQIEQSLLESARGELEKAERTIKNCLTQARKFGWNRAVFMAQLAGAQINCSRGREKQALSCLRRAILLAKHKGYDGLLLREFRANPRLVGLAQQAKVEQVYLGKILHDRNTAVQGSGNIPGKARLLGRFELSAATSQNTCMKRKTSKAILSYILLHPNSSFTWESIAAWAWPDSPPKAAHHMFRRAICEIHHCFPPLKTLLGYRGNTYSLADPNRIWVDVREFGILLNRADSAADELQKYDLIKQAIELYQGPLLPDFYYTWIDDLRNQLEEKYTAALGSLAQWYFVKQQYEASAQLCHKYLQTDELDESINRLLMEVYIRQGRNSLAIKQYKHFVKMLRRNYGTNPSPETVSLIKSLH